MHRHEFQFVTCLVVSALLSGAASASAGDPPGFYPEANSKGTQLAQARKFNEALKELNLEIASKPSGDAYYWRASCWSDNYNAAIADYTKAIELKLPQSANAYLLRGFIRWRQRQDDEALADYSRCIELEPKAGSAYYYRALILSALNKPAAAAADLTRAIELDPANAKLYCDRGRAESDSGEPDKALADYAKAIELDPKNPDPYFKRSFVLEDKGEWAAATIEINKAVAAGSDRSDAHVAAARFMLRKGDMKGATLAFTKAIELDPKSQFCRYFRGCLWYDLGELSAALEDFGVICEGEANDWCDYAHGRSWLIRARQGEIGAATQELKKYLESRTTGKPDDWSAKILYVLAGQLPEADFIKGAEDIYAASAKGKADRIVLCEAYFYAGSRRLVTGDKGGAKSELEKCLALDLKDSSDYISAAAELKFLRDGK